MKIKRLVVGLILVGLLGCATSPTAGKTYTASEIRTQIGEQTSFGIMFAIFSTLGAIYTLGQFSNPPEDTNDQGETKKDYYSAIIGLFATGVLIHGATLSFKAKSEWEGELDKVRQAMLNPIPNQKLVQTFAH